MTHSRFTFFPTCAGNLSIGTMSSLASIPEVSWSAHSSTVVLTAMRRVLGESSQPNKQEELLASQEDPGITRAPCAHIAAERMDHVSSGIDRAMYRQEGAISQEPHLLSKLSS